MRLLRVAPLLLLFAAGCALIEQLVGGGFEKPSLQFREARLRRIDFAGAQLELIFTVTNPNRVALRIAGAKYSLQIEGHEVASGAPAAGLQIPARGSADVAFPAEVRWSEAAPAVAALFAQEVVHYKAQGEVGVETPIGVVTLPLQHEGTFASPRLPKLSLQPPRLASLSPLGARLLLPVTISNPNDFPLPIAGVAGDVTIAGAPVAQIALPEQRPIAPRADAVVQVPIDLSFIASGPRVAEAIRAGSAEIALDAVLQIAGASVPLRVTQIVALRR